jgi:hypothetical protein
MSEKMKYILATVMMVVLLGSLLAAQNFSAYAAGNDKDDHKKGLKSDAKSEDKDKDDKKKCTQDPDEGKNSKGKYKHDCDSHKNFTK